MSDSSTGYEVTVETLRAEAKLWQEQGAALGGIPSSVQALKFDRMQSGVFQLFTDANDAMVDAVAARAGEGSTEMAKIAEGLRVTAQAYELREQDVSRGFDKV
ncbi:type VII secretion target [Streptacidiphilus sp. EB129]|uniref:type VII secretion target n=1 Tax=Streptacidiphilus sp. EB129 TaxID=3156262 RepID=UPI0035140C02